MKEMPNYIVCNNFEEEPEDAFYRKIEQRVEDAIIQGCLDDGWSEEKAKEYAASADVDTTTRWIISRMAMSHEDAEKHAEKAFAAAQANGKLGGTKWGKERTEKLKERDEIIQKEVLRLYTTEPQLNGVQIAKRVQERLEKEKKTILESLEGNDNPDLKADALKTIDDFTLEPESLQQYVYRELRKLKGKKKK